MADTSATTGTDSDKEDNNSSDDDLQPAQFLYKKKSDHLVLTPRRGIAPDNSDSPVTPAVDELKYGGRQSGRGRGRGRGRGAGRVSKYNINSLLSSKESSKQNEQNIKDMEQKLDGVALENGGILSLISREAIKATEMSDHEDDNSQNESNDSINNFPDEPTCVSIFNTSQQELNGKKSLLSLPVFFSSFIKLGGDQTDTPEKITEKSNVVITTILSNSWLCSWDHNQTLSNDVYEWCFEQLCFSEDILISGHCYEFLLSANQWRCLKGLEPKLLVQVKEYVTLLLKCGVNFENIKDQLLVMDWSNEQIDKLKSIQQIFDISSLNTKYVLLFLNNCLGKYHSKYDGMALTCFIQLSCLLLMDQNIIDVRYLILDTISYCLSAYDEELFNTQVVLLMKNLTNLNSHHHMMSLLVDLLPLNPRGKILKNITANSMMKLLIGDPIDSSVGWKSINDNTVKTSLSILTKLNLSYQECDYYKTNSILTLLGSAVTSYDNVYTKNEDGILKLISSLKYLNLQIKDSSGAFLNRSKVKASLLKITTILSLNVKGESILMSAHDDYFHQTSINFKATQIELLDGSKNPLENDSKHDHWEKEKINQFEPSDKKME